MNRQERLQQLVNETFAGNQASFAKAIARAPAQVSHWLTGHRKLGDAGARHIEMTLNLGIGFFDGKSRQTAFESSPYPDSPEQKASVFEDSTVHYGNAQGRFIPVFELDAISASLKISDQPTDNTKNSPIYVEDDRLTSAAFAVVVDNESMRSRFNPSFEPGDYLVCDPSVSAVAGDFVIAKESSTQQPTFKKLVHDSGRWFLASLNEAFPPMREIDEPNQRVIARVMQRVKISKF